MTERLGVSTSDLRRLLDIVDPARCGEAGEELPYSTLADLAELLPCDEISITRANLTERRVWWQTAEEAGQGATEEDLFWPAAQDWHDSPDFCPSGVEASETRLEDLSHYTSAQADYVDAAMRLNGVSRFTHLCAVLRFEGQDDCTVELLRVSGSPFGARELLLLALLRPHLIAMRREHRRRLSDVPAVTQRQREILQLVAAGHSNRQIARALFVSEATVRKHLENAYERLDVSNRSAAVAKLAAS